MMKFVAFKLPLCFVLFAALTSLDYHIGIDDESIKPWSGNPRYWQYKGNPVLLLGGTDNDNLFQNDNLKSHLDSLRMAGGNYVRNTMSDRDPGDEKAFALRKDGKYDLTKWNRDYWRKFENLLRLAGERDIIVQIEIWDRFDHSRDNWLNDPYNPKNNVNYTYSEAKLDSVYPLHPGQNKQPFFFTVPELQNNEVLLKYQKAFVKKLLSISLKYPNVLYCIDNETTASEAWGAFWAKFIKENAGGRKIYVTEMWDTWDVKTPIHKRTIDHPELYDFIDISQNSQITGRQNWDNAQYVFNYIKDKPRPVNSTKIYGNDRGSWLDRGINTDHAVQTFCRNVLGGFASARFHRPPSGLGLSPLSINCIKTIRKIEEKVRMWDIVPRMDLLMDAEDNEAYLAAKEGEVYVVLFTNGGEATLDLRGHNKRFSIDRISVDNPEWIKAGFVEGNSLVKIDAGTLKTCFAVIQALK